MNKLLYMVIVREYVKRILKSFEKDTYLHKRGTFHCAKIQKKLRIKAYDKLFFVVFLLLVSKNVQQYV